MRNRAARALPAFALVAAVGIAVGGCATAAGGTGAASASAASAGSSGSSGSSGSAGSAASAGSSGSSASAGSSPAATAAARASAPVYGPPGPDPACAAALKAEQTLRARQDKDQANESALDQDFTDFADALSTAAQRDTRPATAKAMTALANDYTALVQSQSGAAELPDMSTVEKDGAAFDKACS